MSDYHNFYFKKSGNNYFCHFSLLSTKIISFFMLFTSFASSAHLRSHPHIEPKHGFDWGHITEVMSNAIA